MQQKLYLHRSCVPLDMVDLEHEKTLFQPMTNECQGMCGGEAIPPLQKSQTTLANERRFFLIDANPGCANFYAHLPCKTKNDA